MYFHHKKKKIFILSIYEHNLEQIKDICLLKFINIENIKVQKNNLYLNLK